MLDILGTGSETRAESAVRSRTATSEAVLRVLTALSPRLCATEPPPVSANNVEAAECVQGGLLGESDDEDEQDSDDVNDVDNAPST